MKYKDLDFKPHPNPFAGFDTQVLVFFSNGYGASIVTGANAYGGLELAVLKGVPGDYDLTYDTEITNDVLGHLTKEKVEKLLERISKL